MNINRILVTGGSGFVGSHFIRHMLSKYPEVQVVNIDNLSTGNLGNLSDIKTNHRYHFVRADMREHDTLDAVLSEGVDAVVNAAGVCPSPLGHNRSYIDGNVGTLTALLDRIAHYNSLEGYKVQRFIQLSSYEVYGNGGGEPVYHVQPASRYAVSKAAADMECLVRKNDANIPAMILRMSEIHGSGQHIAHGMNALLNNKDQWFDMRFPYETYEWLSVYDVVNAIDFLMHRGKVGEIYHAGSGEYASIRDIQKCVQARTPLMSSKERGDYPDVSAEALWELGWRPKVSLDAMY
ncbi:MAG: NAD-dependent epimerase/dehydratase family protein [Patescibacteria group bacterium]